MPTKHYRSGAFSDSTPATGVYRGIVTEVTGKGRVSVEIPRLSQSVEIRNAPYLGTSTARVGDNVWCHFLEGRSSAPVCVPDSDDNLPLSPIQASGTNLVYSTAGFGIWDGVAIPQTDGFDPIGASDDEGTSLGGSADLSARQMDLFVPCSVGDVLPLEMDFMVRMPEWTITPVIFRFESVLDAASTGNVLSSTGWQAWPLSEESSHRHDLVVPVAGEHGWLVKESDYDYSRGGVRLRVHVINQNSAAPSATSTITMPVNPSDGDTLVVHNRTYTFESTLTNVNGNVQIGASAADTQANLVAAFDLSGTAGVDYASSMTAHSTVSISAFSSNVATVTSDLQGVIGNSYSISETFTSGSNAVGGTYLTGGDDIVLLSGSTLLMFQAPMVRCNGVRRRRPGTNLIAVGQSLNHTPLGETYPLQLQALLHDDGYLTGLDVMAWSGSSFSQRSGFMTVGLDDHLLGYERNIMLLWGGFTDIQGGDSAQDVFDTKAAVAAAARTAGVDYVVALTNPDTLWLSEPMKDILFAQNQLLLDDQDAEDPVFDAVVDVYSIPEMQDASDTVYFPDGTHFSEVAAGMVAALARDSLLPLMY